MLDQLDLHVNVELLVIGPDGEIKDRVQAHNLVPTVGKEKFAERMVLASPATEGPKYIAVGKSSTAAAAGDTALVEEVKRKEATTRTVSGAVGTLVVTFAKTEATAAIKEAGLFSASTVGTLYARLVFAEVNVTAEDELKVTWTVTAS